MTQSSFRVPVWSFLSGCWCYLPHHGPELFSCWGLFSPLRGEFNFHFVLERLKGNYKSVTDASTWNVMAFLFSQHPLSHSHHAGTGWGFLRTFCQVILTLSSPVTPHAVHIVTASVTSHFRHSSACLPSSSVRMGTFSSATLSAPSIFSASEFRS